jgi:hypothetical protein
MPKLRVRRVPRLPLQQRNDSCDSDAAAALTNVTHFTSILIFGLIFTNAMRNKRKMSARIFSVQLSAASVYQVLLLFSVDPT